MRSHQSLQLSAVAGACAALIACSSPSADQPYFGKVQPPDGQVLRYITGSEPESLDPQIGSGQPEARIYVSLFDGLTEFDPITGKAIPSLASRWDVSDANSTFTFYLRAEARWSDGSPITADDVVYTVRRGMTPAFASRLSYMAYDIAYAEAFNNGSSFVRDPRTGEFLPDPDNPGWRLTVPSGETLTPDLRAKAQGKELVPVTSGDIGVEALDAHTVRFRTMRPVPFFPDLMGHQFFRLVPRQAIDRYGDAWTRPGRLVASGAFMLETWKPYDRLSVVRNPMFWDAASVKLDRITFYPTDDLTTMMNLYKAGVVDATYNHTVPAAWVDGLRGMKDYMDQPENASEFWCFNVTAPPTNDVRVRKALSLAVDKVSLAAFRRTAKPGIGLVPSGIFPGYPSLEGNGFDPDRAKELLAEAGFRGADGLYDPARFPSGEMELAYNTSESNRQVAEFIQAQWKQHLGLTISLRNFEFRTFIVMRANKEYKGAARSGWVGDYMDPFSFLDLLSTPAGSNGTGWSDPRYVALLRAGNREPDPRKRYDALAQAERMAMDAQAILPLFTPATNWLKKPYVKGMYANPITIHAWKYVYIEHDPAKWD